MRVSGRGSSERSRSPPPSTRSSQSRNMIALLLRLDAAALLGCTELEHRSGVVHLSGTQDHRGKLRLVRRIGKVMRLEGQPVAVLVDVPALSYGAAIEEV